jgi:hypothetical protein
VFREVRLGDAFYFVLWDDMTDQAAVAKGEVTQYASDYSKVRLRVVESPIRTVLGRSTWLLPDRLDPTPQEARTHYQQRARTEVRQAFAPGKSVQKGEGAVEGPASEHWAKVVRAWGDVDLLLDTVEFESGWPENQHRLAKLATLAVLAMRPDVTALLGTLGHSEEAENVRLALETGTLGAAAQAAGNDPSGLLRAWDDADAATLATAPQDISALRAALEELSQQAGLQPSLTPAEV